MDIRPPQQKLATDIIREVTGISEEHLRQAAEIQKETREPLAQTLVNMGLISERDKAKCLGKQWGVPYVDLSERQPDKEALKLVPRHLLQRFHAVPIVSNGKRITMAMVNPLDIFAIDQLRLVAGLEIEPVIATEDDINNALGQGLATTEEIGEALKQVADEVGGPGEGDLTIEQAHQEEELSVDQLKELLQDAPVVRLVNLIIRQAIRDKASDIHIQPEANRVRVRVRIDGILHDKMVTPKAVQAALVSRIKVMADMDIAEKRRPQDGRISLALSGREYDFRVSTYPSVHGEKVVMRVLDKRGVQVNLNKLGMPASMMDDFENLINRSYGIITVTGPTGSGKSTTLYAVLNKINSPERNTMTIEDPVEYQLPGLTQGQVNTKAGVTFATALRTMLRQDPDVILVGEMRDAETIALALTAAETGVQVLATLHTSGAARTIDRIINVFPPRRQDQIRVMLADSLRMIVSQRLARTRDGGQRIAVVEILINTHAVAAMIRSSSSHKLESAIQTGQAAGMQSLDATLRTLVRDGMISAEEAHACAIDKIQFEHLLAVERGTATEARL